MTYCGEITSAAVASKRDYDTSRGGVWELVDPSPKPLGKNKFVGLFAIWKEREIQRTDTPDQRFPSIARHMRLHEYDLTIYRQYVEFSSPASPRRRGAPHQDLPLELSLHLLNKWRSEALEIIPRDARRSPRLRRLVRSHLS